LLEIVIRQPVLRCDLGASVVSHRQVGFQKEGLDVHAVHVDVSEDPAVLLQFDVPEFDDLVKAFALDHVPGQLGTVFLVGILGLHLGAVDALGAHREAVHGRPLEGQGGGEGQGITIIDLNYLSTCDRRDERDRILVGNVLEAHFLESIKEKNTNEIIKMMTFDESSEIKTPELIHMTVKEITDLERNEKLILPLNARDDERWDKQRRDEYFASVLRGTAPTPFVLEKTKDGRYLVIDAGNRKKNLRKIVDNEVKIGKNKGKDVGQYLSQKPAHTKEKFLNSKLTVIIYHGLSLKMREDLYRDINQSQKLTSGETIRGYNQTDWLSQILEKLLTESDIENFLEKSNLSSKRLAQHRWIGQFVLNVLKNVDRDNDDISWYSDDYNPKFSHQTDEEFDEKRILHSNFIRLGGYPYLREQIIKLVECFTDRIARANEQRDKTTIKSWEPASIDFIIRINKNIDVSIIRDFLQNVQNDEYRIVRPGDGSLSLKKSWQCKIQGAAQAMQVKNTLVKRYKDAFLPWISRKHPNVDVHWIV
jgi:hypothetical protein